MSRPNPAILFGFFLAVIAIFGGVALAKGGFYLAKHEGDTLHLLQIVFRMASGEWPHLDFMTPLGFLSFAPITLFLNLGLGAGMSILLSQILVALVLLPALIWAGTSRFEGALGYFFGFVVLVLVLALVHGQAERSVSISMHYNRWAWAVSYIVIVLAALPPREVENELMDGLFIGFGMAFLVLLKVTYFVAFAPAVVMGLALRRAFPVLRVALFTGFGVAIAMALLAGTEYWAAFVADLLAVSGSDVRPQPGPPLRTIITAPAYLGGSLIALGAVILMRQAGEDALGLVLLVLLPGFIYVTYQNFGNDPQWLMLLAILLLVPSPRPEMLSGLGWNMKQSLVVAAAVAIAFATPSFLNLTFSPFRHFSLPVADYSAMLPNEPTHRDLRVITTRSNRVDGLMAMDTPGSGLEDRAARADRDRFRTVFLGEELPECELQGGLPAWFETIVMDLETNGFAQGKKLFAADIFSGHWLFGSLARLENGAPWYYGGLPGFENADYLLVPLCPTSISVRKQILEEVAGQDIALRELRRTPLYILYGIVRS